MNLEEFAKMHILPAQAIVMAGAELTPLLIFESATKGVGIAAIPEYGNPAHKGPIREILRGLLAEQEATRYAVIMEAWMSVSTSPQPKIAPRDDPNHKEAIVISAADCDGSTITVMCFINRAAEITFSEPEIIPIGTSPLLELLTKPTRH